MLSYQQLDQVLLLQLLAVELSPINWNKSQIYKLALMHSYVRCGHHGWGGICLSGQHLCQPRNLVVQV